MIHGINALPSVGRVSIALASGLRAEWKMQDIVEFIFFPVINEGCRVVEERIVDKPSDLDVAAVLGMGFPPYRGGLIKFADLVGAKHIVARLKVRVCTVPRFDISSHARALQGALCFEMVLAQERIFGTH